MSDKGKLVARRQGSSSVAKTSNSSTTMTSNTKVIEKAYAMQKTTRTKTDVFKDPNTATTHMLTQTKKTGDYIDRKTGSIAHFQEEKYKSTFKTSNGSTFGFEVITSQKTKDKGKKVIKK